MFKTIQRWCEPGANPIGIDLGSSSLRLAQVRMCGAEHHLIAAASAEVPPELRAEPADQLQFFSDTIPSLLAQAKFRGRQAILAMPARWTFVRHVRMPKTEPGHLQQALDQALVDGAVGDLPIEPADAALRYILAGEVYHEQEPRHELILMATPRRQVADLLAAAERAKLQVVGLIAEASILVDCFGHVYRRKTDRHCTNCFIDTGASGTRVTIARDGKILFMRAISISDDELKGTAESSIAALDKLLEELRMCRRYHEGMFPALAVERIIFVGGGAQNRTVCQHIANGLGLPAQVGDPLVRMARQTNTGAGAIDRRQSQPAWAVAMGCTFGPAPLSATAALPAGVAA